MSVKDIVKKTFVNLEKQGTLPTPNEYAREFYAIAADEKFPLRDFDKLYAIVKIIQKSVEPALSKNDTTGLVNLIMDLNNAPHKIFDDATQKRIENFLKTKTQVDSQELELKTQKFAMLVKHIGNFLSEAIDVSKVGNEELEGFINELEDNEVLDQDNFNELQQKLITMAKSLNSTMDSTNQKLQKSQGGIGKLKDEIEQLKKELADAKKESEIDHLTGIPTRRTFDKQVKIFELNYQQNDVPYAIVFYDIDFFKKVNDTYGHDAGDFILNTFAKVLDSSTRKTDVIARYGGEEFIAIVQYESPEELIKYTKRIKAIVKNYTFKYKDKRIDITFSSGVYYRKDAKNLEDCIKKADELLYKAKNNGRDRIIFGDDTVI
ncbi:MAG TPA: diguanylate cyclase [Arcobacter sp.]|jgi:diguanylate cyclase (GGDEF)-like protein|nr:diguanylate cyclase [Arcobacter sp.]